MKISIFEQFDEWIAVKTLKCSVSEVNICQAFVKKLWEVWSKAKDNIKVQESSQSVKKSPNPFFQWDSFSSLFSLSPRFSDKTLWEECTRYLLWASEDQ